MPGLEKLLVYIGFGIGIYIYRTLNTPIQPVSAQAYSAEFRPPWGTFGSSVVPFPEFWGSLGFTENSSRASGASREDPGGLPGAMSVSVKDLSRTCLREEATE